MESQSFNLNISSCLSTNQISLEKIGGKMKIGVPCYPLALVNKIATNRKHQCSILDSVIHPSLILNIFNCRTQQITFMMWQG